ncbi:hypothetical protein Rhow_007086 [Rhodococcus wratislaviensis]|uniref:TIR domain-containing protein n=1 Tax=Rhodococcus wratislaviensis TaxID=44752 RepID=A0A402CHB5_RHOWR|nr:toll/interleukin-1 receptor domain-containing protein [Rhodococcus wratislaviensis]GCE42957.1 hypothetical protein Rhow_007086 [Rhodococcus wratislaviensis]
MAGSEGLECAQRRRLRQQFGQRRALRVFRDSMDITAGTDIWGAVREAMDKSRYMVVLLTLHSVGSQW